METQTGNSLLGGGGGVCEKQIPEVPISFKTLQILIWTHLLFYWMLTQLLYTVCFFTLLSQHQKEIHKTPLMRRWPIISFWLIFGNSFYFHCPCDDAERGFDLLPQHSAAWKETALRGRQATRSGSNPSKWKIEIQELSLIRGRQGLVYCLWLRGWSQGL